MRKPPSSTNILGAAVLATLHSSFSDAGLTFEPSARTAAPSDKDQRPPAEAQARVDAAEAKRARRAARNLKLAGADEQGRLAAAHVIDEHPLAGLRKQEGSP